MMTWDNRHVDHGFYFLQQGLQVVLAGGLLVAAPLALLTAWGRKQWLFEWKNSDLVRPTGTPWMAFEVSSEGELEQVRPLLEYFVQQIKEYNATHQDQRYLELVFASPSVEKKALKLGEQYPGAVFVVRLPLLSWGWRFLGRQNLATALRAPNVFFCRYDFFPHLLVWALRQDHRAFLLSATLKNKLKSKFSRWFWQKLMKSFYHVVFATEEKERWAQIDLAGDQMSVYDFRHGQIVKRLQNSVTTLGAKAFYAPFIAYLDAWPREKRVIIGSAWPPEMKMLQNSAWQEALQNKTWQLTIAPHQLKASAVETLAHIVQQELGLAPAILSPDLSAAEVAKRLADQPSVVIVTVPGILCELYRDFGHTFVGGGYGRSIHSLLEPYWAGGMLYGGPKVFRSTEYDYVVQNSPAWINLLDDAGAFYPTCLTKLPTLEHWAEEKARREQKAREHQEKFLLLATNLLQSLLPPQ